MSTVKPIKIFKPKPYLLACEFSDGFSATIKLEHLRKECPCAQCTTHEKKPAFGSDITLLSTFKPGMNELKNLRKVGNYAIAAEWGDGHNTGIYTWEFLREIFEKYALSEQQLIELEKKFG